MQPFEKFQKLRVLFVHAKNLARFLRAQIGEQDRTLFAKLRNPPAHRDAVRTAFLVSKPLEQQRFHFRRNGVFHALRFVVRLCPGESDYFGQQHFRELMPQREMFRTLAAFLRQVDPSAAFHAHVAVARHALQCSSHGGRGYSLIPPSSPTERSPLRVPPFPACPCILCLLYSSLFSLRPNNSLSAVFLLRVS